MDLRIEDLDHIVLRCNDVEATLAWYIGELGLEGERVDQWRAGAILFPSVRVNDGTIIDLVPANFGPEHPVDAAGHLDHLCLCFEPFDADALVTSGRFRVQEGPVTRFGARGDAVSVYVLDPDDTVIELRYYP